MHAQVLCFQLKEGRLQEFRALVDHWTNARGKPLSGCTGIITCWEIDGADRCVITVLFDNEKALAEFSNDRDSLDIFDKAKDLVVGKVQYFDARADSTTL